MSEDCCCDKVILTKGQILQLASIARYVVSGTIDVWKSNQIHLLADQIYASGIKRVYRKLFRKVVADSYVQAIAYATLLADELDVDPYLSDLANEWVVVASKLTTFEKFVVDSDEYDELLQLVAMSKGDSNE
jgi:hypothetical protein